MKEKIWTSGDINLKELLDEYALSGSYTDGYERLEYADDIRYTRWPGQSKDGKKWDENLPEGKRALPWNGCSDTRVPMADEIIVEQVDILVAAFWRAALRAQSVEIDDQEISGYATRYMDWLRGSKLNKSLRTEVELLAQYGQQYGWGVMYTGWDREVSSRDQEITIELLQQIIQQIPDFEPILETLPDEERDDETAGFVQTLYQIYVASMPGIYPEDIKPLKMQTAKKAVRDLRTTGSATISIPYVCKNQPLLQALKPWEECAFPPGTRDLQSARAIFWRQWMTETELRSRADAEDWDETWVEEAIKYKGATGHWASVWRRDKRVATDSGIYTLQDPLSKLIEVVYGHTKRVEDDGTTNVYCTVFSPPIQAKGDLIAKHEKLDYTNGMYPFTPYIRENTGRSIDESRGVCDVVATWQHEEKSQRDMILNRSHWDTLPPVVVPRLLGVDYKLGPASQVPESRVGSLRFLDPPKRGPDTSIDAIRMIQTRTNNYFGRIVEEVHPARQQIRMEKMVKNFFLTWSEVWQKVFGLVTKYADKNEIQRVVGAKRPFEFSQTQSQYDFVMNFDARELNPDFLLQKLDMISKLILPLDINGVVDRTPLVKAAMRAVDPSFPDVMIQDEQSASQELFRKVNQDIALMALGNEPQYTEEDPTAGRKLQYAGQVIQANQKYQQALSDQGDPHFKALMQKYQQNLQQSISQQQNKVVGRIGVTPMAMEQQSQQAQPVQ